MTGAAPFAAAGLPAFCVRSFVTVAEKCTQNETGTGARRDG